MKTPAAKGTRAPAGLPYPRRALAQDLALLAQALAGDAVPPELAEEYHACLHDPSHPADALLLAARDRYLALGGEDRGK